MEYSISNNPILEGNMSSLVYDILLEYIENRLNKSSFVSILKTLSQYNIKDKNQISQTTPQSVESVLKQFEKSCSIGLDFKQNRKKVELINKSGELCQFEIEFLDPIKIFQLYLESDLDHMEVNFSYFFDGYVADSYTTHGLYGLFEANVFGAIERLFNIKIAFLKDSKLIKINNENIQKAFEIILKNFFGDIPGLASAFNFGGSNALNSACFECHCPNNQMHDLSQTFPPKLKEEYIKILNMKPGEIDRSSNLSKEQLMKINNINLPMSPILKFPKSIQDLLKGYDWLHIELLGFFKRLTQEFCFFVGKDYRLLLECLSIAASEIDSERQIIKDFIEAIFLCEQYYLCLKIQDRNNSIRRNRLKKQFIKNNKGRTQDEEYNNQLQKHISRGFIKLHLQKHQLEKIVRGFNPINTKTEQFEWTHQFCKKVEKTKSNKKKCNKKFFKILNLSYKFNDNYNETCFFKLVTSEDYVKKGNEDYYLKVSDKLKQNGETEFRLNFIKSIKYKNVKYSIKDFISIKGDGERVWYGQIFDILAILNVEDNKLKEIVFLFHKMEINEIHTNCFRVMYDHLDYDNLTFENTHICSIFSLINKISVWNIDPLLYGDNMFTVIDKFYPKQFEYPSHRNVPDNVQKFYQANSENDGLYPNNEIPLFNKCYLNNKRNKFEIKERIETYYDDKNKEMGNFQRTMSLRTAFRNIRHANNNTETFIENKKLYFKNKSDNSEYLSFRPSILSIFQSCEQTEWNLYMEQFGDDTNNE
ncbi:hypothetical protein ACTFIZ_000250 [Dictyostelium cf. discoideum]